MEIFIVKTLDIENKVLEKLSEYISYEKKLKVNKLKNKNDKIQAVISEILVRAKIIEKYKIKNKDIDFLKNEYGKPYIDKIKDFYFNISHSGEYVVIAISNKEVGIDIEKIKDIEYCDLAKNFFTSSEYKYIMKENELERFYDMWTLKESYIKFEGKGLSIPLNSFEISIEDKEIKIINNKVYTNHVLNKIDILSGYKLSICKIDNKDFEIKILNQQELINYFFKLNEKENL